MKSHSISFDEAVKVADEMISELSPVCLRLSTVGQLRRKSPEINEIRILAIPKTAIAEVNDDLFLDPVTVSLLDDKLKLLQNLRVLSLSRNGNTLMLDGVHIPVKIICTTEFAWEAMLFHHTASKNLFMAVQTVCKAKGILFAPEEGCFKSRAGDGARRMIRYENDVFKVTGIPYLAPELRGGGAIFQLKETGRKLPMPVSECRTLIEKSQWVDTRYAGEAHQYTLRVLSGSEVNFVHLVETIRSYGYDGYYLGKAYRYLDIDGYMYFTQGYDMRVTFLINRKKLRQQDTPWKLNQKKLEIIPAIMAE